jgi:hypothetical protein
LAGYISAVADGPGLPRTQFFVFKFMRSTD